MKNIISFPHIGDYHFPVSYLIKHITKQEVLVPPKITKKTLKLGTQYSPDYVCVPFKYNLGNYIEALDKGANIILQAGGGCRYGYYAELQEQILKDIGYSFEFANFIQDNHVSFFKIYKFAKRLNKKLNPLLYIHYLLNTLFIIIYMDKLDIYMRHNMGFAINNKDFSNLKSLFLNNIVTKKNIITITITYFKYKKIYHKVKINKPNNYLKVALLGELFSLMEPFSSNNIEQKLINKNIHIERYTNLTYLLITKRFKLPILLRKGKKYLRYHLGADGTESVVLSYLLSKKGIDGIIHVKSFGCTPEINAMPIMNKISNEYNTPIMFLSFDSQDNELGIDTKIEAFYDMILARREK